MKIYSKSFFGTHHSWAHVMRSLMRIFCLDNQVSINSINGYEHLNEELFSYVENFIGNPDLEICYTMPHNFNRRFLEKSKVKMAIYNYESSVLPKEWLSKIKHVDFCLPSSKYSQDIFVRNGWPIEKCPVVPHGIFLDDYKNKKKLNYFENINKFKFLNVSIPHYRKNIPTLIEAFYDAFSSKDDVLLILKTSLKRPEKYFEIDVRKELVAIQERYKRKDLPSVMIVEQKIKDMIPLYNSIDCLINCSSGEGFGLPMLEALAAEKIVIAPDKGGQVDFLNKNNSILFKSKISYAPKNYQYWVESDKSEVISFNKKDLTNSMLKVFNEYKYLRNKLNFDCSNFSWQSAANKIYKLTND